MNDDTAQLFEKARARLAEIRRLVPALGDPACHALDAAVQTLDLESVIAWLARGVSARNFFSGERKQSLFQLACEVGDLQIAQLMLAAGVNIDYIKAAQHCSWPCNVETSHWCSFWSEQVQT